MMNSNPNRAGMSTGSWNWSLVILEIALDFIKGATVVLGVLAASIADVAMGAISVSILFGINVSLYTKTPAWLVSTVLSLGASAFQVYLFAVLQRRKIGLTQLLNWKKLERDVKTIIGVAGLLWLVDTFMDVSPVFLLVRDSQYQVIPNLYLAMIVAVAAIVFLLCGFSELLTSNMRSILQISPPPAPSPRREQTTTPPSRHDTLRTPSSSKHQEKPQPEGRPLYGREETAYHPVSKEQKVKTSSEEEIKSYLQQHRK